MRAEDMGMRGYLRGEVTSDDRQVIIFDFGDLNWGASLVILGVILIYTVAISGMFLYTIHRSQAFPTAQALVASLALLTFIALTSAVITGSQSLETIAATGFGAIAGAVSHQFAIRRDDEA